MSAKVHKRTLCWSGLSTMSLSPLEPFRFLLCCRLSTNSPLSSACVSFNKPIPGKQSKKCCFEIGYPHFIQLVSVIKNIVPRLYLLSFTFPRPVEELFNRELCLVTIFGLLPLGSAWMYDMAVASGVNGLPWMISIEEVAASKVSSWISSSSCTREPGSMASEVATPPLFFVQSRYTTSRKALIVRGVLYSKPINSRLQILMLSFLSDAFDDFLPTFQVTEFGLAPV